MYHNTMYHQILACVNLRQSPPGSGTYLSALHSPASDWPRLRGIPRAAPDWLAGAACVKTPAPAPGPEPRRGEERTCEASSDVGSV